MGTVKQNFLVDPRNLNATTPNSFGLLKGPWLRTYPFVPHYFQIAVAAPTSYGPPPPPPPAIFVENARGTKTIPAVSTHSIADCASVNKN
jgi:hypothetical protein